MIQAKRPGATVSDGTARRELGTLAAALSWCHREGILLDPPAVDLPPKPPAKERYLTRNEVSALIRAARRTAHGAHLPLYILIGIYTGARKEAILGLQWEKNLVGGYVDLAKGEIDFRIPGKQTDKRRSCIPIPARLLRFLRAARSRTRQYVIEYRGVRVLDVKKGFAGAVRVAGLTGVSPHTLRHTAVRWLVAKGVPLWTVAGWVGMSEAMIRSTYGHHTKDKFADILKALK